LVTATTRGTEELSTDQARTGADRFLPSGSEAGTAPEDRPFRPDVEGLRAVAVLLVVLFHSGVSALSGGYIGVDVFFVISGFVITGVLLRERVSTGRTSILAFYGRRARRIIPAATLVIIVTVVTSYVFLGVGSGGRTADDGKWAAVFLANFHFSAIGTNYFSAQQPPSPLQNYWTLSVEEQFYVVYPTLFLLLASVGRRLSLQVRLAIGLVLVIGASLTFSIVDTSSHATSAYFSPFTRAWELALGALVAVGTPWLKRVPPQIATLATWTGFGAILVAATTFTSQTAYPGSLVAIPVVGAALIIAGGARAPRRGVEALLGLGPIRTLGKLSYSLYLWHWPILIIAAEYAGKTSLTVPQNLGWDLVALAASAVTYALLENPVRHAKVLLRIRWASVGLGVALVAMTLGTVSLSSVAANGSGTGSGKTPTSVATPGASRQAVLRLVAASDEITTVPANLVPPLSQVAANQFSDGGFPPYGTCFPPPSPFRVAACTFGDRAGESTMVLYGDSYAGMWFQALNAIALNAHWRLIVLARPSCPASPIPVTPVGGTGDWTQCDQWHRYVINYINRLDPNLLIVSQFFLYKHPSGLYYTPGQWRRGLEALFTRITAPKTAKLVLGSIPNDGGGLCLVGHPRDVQECSIPRNSVASPDTIAEKLAAAATGARYIDVLPWFCTDTCSPIIGNYDVYILGNHLTLGYSLFLRGVLAQAIDLGGSR